MKKIIISIIVLVILIGAGVYILGKKKIDEKIIESVVVETPEAGNQINNIQANNFSDAAISGGEDSASEVFKNQPGAIKTITNQGDIEWSLAVDLLTKNPNWRPGGETEFFVNQNPKIRNLLVTKDTKTYECNGVSADQLKNTSNFISDIQVYIAKMAAESQKFGTKKYDYTAYFDIDGSKITAIYQQCLP